MLSLWSSAKYTFPLPATHRFPVAKYALLTERVVSQQLAKIDQIHSTPA